MEDKKVMGISAIEIFTGTTFLLLVIMSIGCLCRQTRAEAETKGLSSNEIKSLGQFTFRTETYRLRLRCSVCLSHISEGQQFRVLPDCRHNFHLVCIDQWLARHGTCPICRKRVKTRVIDHMLGPFYGSDISEEDNANSNIGSPLDQHVSNDSYVTIQTIATDPAIPRSESNLSLQGGPEETEEDQSDPYSCMFSNLLRTIVEYFIEC